MLTLLKKIVGKVGFIAFKSDKSIHSALHWVAPHAPTLKLSSAYILDSGSTV